MILRAGVIISILVFALPTHAAEYFYDDLSRLVGYVDEQGNAVQYQYDAVGNRLAVLSYPAGTLATVAITPAKGIIGSSVEILGTGFDPAAANNAVSFTGGATGTITAATASKLTVTAPPGTHTGGGSSCTSQRAMSRHTVSRSVSCRIS